MKASLLSAHDVGGVSGAFLRSRIRLKLVNEFYKNPVNRCDRNYAMLALVGLSFCIVTFILLFSSPFPDILLARYLDLSVTQDFVLVVFAWTLFIVNTVVSALLTYLFISIGMPLTRQLGGYELQRARDEIDL